MRMDSSDEFAWTDTSNNSSDSEAMDVNNKNQSEDESISGKKYKKKLQEQLFAQSNGVVQEKNKHKERRKKRLSESQSDSKHVSLKKEPDSDFDASTVINGQDHSESYDESFLDSKVKSEQFAAPSPTKRKKNKNTSNSYDPQEESYDKANIKSKFKEHSDETELEHDKLNQLVQLENEHLEKKRKKKKKKDKKKKESDMSDEYQSQESQMEISRISHSQVDNESQINDNNHDNTVKIKKNNKVRLSKSTILVTDESPDVDACKNKEQIDPSADRHVSFNTHNVSVKRKPRISERIQFEDDDSTDLDTSPLQNNKEGSKSSKLQSFLKNNSNLSPFINKTDTDSAITINDDIWIIRCPKDVDINAFQNKELTLEGKCKLKLNGQTYEGIVDDEVENTPILLSVQSEFIIKSLPVKGCVNLHKRIPKPHIQDNALVTNSANFIPLPETKSRHPLFGIHYRKAIKLPVSIAERLQALDPEVDVDSEPASPIATPKKKKKSHKEKKINNVSSDHVDGILKAEPEPVKTMLPEEEPDHTASHKKKRKKRKHTDVEDAVPRKKKRKDLDSTEAWESEKAIEENLFNF